MEPSANVIRNDRTTAPVKPQSACGLLETDTLLGGSYRLIRSLAQGGMGDIYLASHERLAGLLAVKVLSPSLACDKEALLRFQQEATVMTTIRHPNVVQVVDFDSTSLGMPYMVMEYLQGEDLCHLMTERTLRPTEISRIIRKVACGLDAAHRLGIVHRDLKPENIMVVPCEGQQDIIKIIDFGICKVRRFGGLTATSTLIGTPEFMSPEQALGNHDDVDARSDQFALAVVSYVLLTGRTPWGTSEPIEILDRVVNHGPLPLRTHVSSSWESVESVLFRGMAKTAEDRYPSTLMFSRALDRAMAVDGLLPTIPSFEPTPLPACVNASDVGGDLAKSDGVVAATPVSSVSGPDVPQGDVTKCASRGRHRLRRRAGYAWQGGVLLIALICGSSLGFVDPATVRARTVGGWNAVQNFAANTATQSTRAAERHLSKFWKASVDYLVAAAGD